VLYWSRGELTALVALLILLLTGTGVLCYRQGMRAARHQGGEPRFLATSAPPPVASVVPAAGSASPAAEAASAPAPPARTAPPRPPKGAGVGTIGLNQATAAQLEALPGIGPVSAKRIVAYRAQLAKANGRGFTSLDQLLDVPGIGPKRFAILRSHLRLD